MEALHLAAASTNRPHPRMGVVSTIRYLAWLPLTRYFRAASVRERTWSLS